MTLWAEPEEIARAVDLSVRGGGRAAAGHMGGVRVDDERGRRVG